MKQEAQIISLNSKKFSLKETSAASRLKTVLHDLKSPLQTLKIISNGHLDNDPRKSEIESRCYEQIKSIVSCKETQNEVETICLPNLLSQAKSQKENELGVFIDLRVSLKNPWISSKLSKEELTVILSNLINNAFAAYDYETFNKLIILKATEKRGKVSISVIDHASGISTQRLDQLGQINKTFTKNGQGLGLNNLIRKVHLYGGDVFCRSFPNLGTQFTISLP